MLTVIDIIPYRKLLKTLLLFDKKCLLQITEMPTGRTRVACFACSPIFSSPLPCHHAPPEAAARAIGIERGAVQLSRYSPHTCGG